MVCRYGRDAWRTLPRWIKVEHGNAEDNRRSVSAEQSNDKNGSEVKFHLVAVLRKQEISCGVPEDILLYAGFCK